MDVRGQVVALFESAFPQGLKPGSILQLPTYGLKPVPFGAG
jgi:hypothetical protein